MKQLLRSFCLGIVSAVMLPVSGWAQSADGLRDVEILSGWRTANGTHITALRVIMEDGWKTYWRSPGEAGIPPQFDWGSSRNLGNVEIVWPAPKPLYQNGLLSIGYENEMVLPLRIAPQTDGEAVALSGSIQIGLCKDICIPVFLQVSQELSEKTSKPDPRIVAALAEEPYSAAEMGVKKVTCQITPTSVGLNLTTYIKVRRLGDKEHVIVETDNPAVWVSGAKTIRQGETLKAETMLYHTEGRPFSLSRSGVRITVLGQNQAVDIRGCDSAD